MAHRGVGADRLGRDAVGTRIATKRRPSTAHCRGRSVRTPTVEAIVDDFYNRVLDDDQLTPYFEDTDMEDPRANQLRFISAVADGPVEYDGGDMREAHTHLGVEKADFDRVGRYLQAALAENGLPDEHVKTIMAEVAALKTPVLNR